MIALYIITGILTAYFFAQTLVCYLEQKKDRSMRPVFEESVRALTIWILLCLLIPVLREMVLIMQ